jgi:hypothetical protein
MRRSATIVATALLLVLGAARVLGQTPDQAQAWIDKPLEWVVIEHTSVGILAHVADPAGVGSAVFLVDGRVIDEVATAGATLEVVEFTWSPVESGVYELRVAGFAVDGSRGGESLITVVVDLGDEPTPTTTVPMTTTTVQPTTTTMAQATTTTCSLGTPVATGPSGLIFTETPTLTWTYSGCEPGYFEVQISYESDFTSVVDSEYIPGGGRQWTVTDPLEGCDTFFWRVRTWEEAGVGPWSNVLTFEVNC